MLIDRKSYIYAADKATIQRPRGRESTRLSSTLGGGRVDSQACLPPRLMRAMRLVNSCRPPIASFNGRLVPNIEARSAARRKSPLGNIEKRSRGGFGRLGCRQLGSKSFVNRVRHSERLLSIAKSQTVQW
jgi:hypothetical protein